MSIQLAIADDHHLIISSIENTVSYTGYIDVCATFNSGESLTEGLKTIKPDVLLLDYHLPDQSGAQLARYITYHYPDIKIIVLTGFDKPGLAMEMLQCGCMGYLLKTSANAEMIVEAINTVHSGRIFLDSSLRDKYAHSIQKDNTAAQPLLKLTNRELDVLKGIASELSSQEIAEQLFISKRTVDNHRTSLMIKSGVKNTVGLIKLAMELKLV
jgi:DNA-binding NarL/FixJ family response regulator